MQWEQLSDTMHQINYNMRAAQNLYPESRGKQ